jgi:hypothetical protein
MLIVNNGHWAVTHLARAYLVIVCFGDVADVIDNSLIILDLRAGAGLGTPELVERFRPHHPAGKFHTFDQSFQISLAGEIEECFDYP